MRSNYSTHLRGCRTWLPLFYWLIDTSIINAFIVLRAMYPEHWNGRNAHKSFREQVAWRLIQGVPRKALQTRNGVVERPNGQARKYRKISRLASSAVRFSNGMHLAVHNGGGNYRRRCVLCVDKLSKAAKAAKTSFTCTGCEEGTFLCIDAQRNCFVEFHNGSQDPSEPMN